MNCLEELVYQRKTDMKTFVMEVTLSQIHCFQNNQPLCKFNFTAMILRLPTHLVPNVVLIKLGRYTLSSEIFFQSSALINIHLVALFHAEDVKKYGFDPILQPLIDDIKVLESHGINLPFSSEKVHGTICQITGDNLGMHGILGFVESFSGRYFCRLCLIEKDDAQNVYNEDDPK